MIRINLLPNKKPPSRSFDFSNVFAGLRGTSAAAPASDSGSQTWVGVLFAVLFLEVIALGLVYKAKNDQLTKVRNKNLESTTSIQSIQANIAQHEKVKAELKDLHEREDAIAKLQSARTGPTAALLELSRMLSPGRGPTVDRDRVEQLRRDNPTAVPNAAWDTRRLWLSTFSEKDRLVKVSGLARDGEDVSEFLRRLSLSEYFFDVKLLPASKEIDPVTKLELVKFEFSAKVKYSWLS